jgi:hypothetical protein
VTSTPRSKAVAAAGIAAVAAAAFAGAKAMSAVGAPRGSAPPCRSHALRLAATFYGEAGGAFIQTLTFTNVSRRGCSMAGWPRVEIETAGGLARPRVRRVVQGNPNAPPFARVRLRSRGAASFDLYGADWNAVRNRACPKTSALRVAPPAGGAPLVVRVAVPACPGGFELAPVVPGRVDRAAWSTVWRR